MSAPIEQSIYLRDTNRNFVIDVTVSGAQSFTFTLVTGQGLNQHPPAEHNYHPVVIQNVDFLDIHNHGHNFVQAPIRNLEELQYEPVVVPNLNMQLAVPTVPAVPAIPAFPTCPVFPTCPAFPIFPTCPAFPNFPAFPTCPAFPAIPAIPAIPAVPAVPAVPALYLPEPDLEEEPIVVRRPQPKRKIPRASKAARSQAWKALMRKWEISTITRMALRRRNHGSSSRFQKPS
uniref:Uncharacterized protein B23I4.020 n=1 Tax=Neurospora crassa TaxID=5141 RepID=Q873L1_NEUCS|nr:conserved hypothetical protein [Neurospora crassa]